MKKFEAKIKKLKAEYNGTRFFIHKLVDNQTATALLNDINGFAFDDYYKSARVCANTNNAVAYRVNSEIYLIPATIKAVVNNGDNKLLFYFDYPCEMVREDLTEY